MKTRNLLIIILVAALLVAYGVIGADYLKQRNQRDAYDTQIAEAAAALILIPQPPADLEERLASAQDSLEEAKNVFMLDATNIEIINTILDTANQTGVKVIPLSTQPWVQESVANQTYAVFRIEIEVTGTYPQLVIFLKQLENGEPKTLVIESLTVESLHGASLLESSVRNTLPITANIRIAVYANPPDGG
jgi:Tfp pilus assembly protein PilO